MEKLNLPNENEDTLQGTGAGPSPETDGQTEAAPTEEIIAEETAAPEPKRMSLKKELLGLLCLLLALAVFCAGTLRFLTPKRHDYGGVWGMYLQEPKDSIDVLFLGSSLAYCNIVPSVLYEETGITSFVMAGPEQTIPMTYYYLKEACKTQSPKTVFIEATGLIFSRTNRSMKVNLTYMPWSENRLVPTFQETLTVEEKTPEATAKKEKEALAGLLFPMYAYHDRWDKLMRRDIEEGLHGYSPDPLAGYTFLKEVTVIDEFGTREFTEDEENYARNLEFAGKIIDYCRKNGIAPVFFFSPYSQRLDEEHTARVVDDLGDLGGSLVDFNDTFDEPGFDLDTDFYDRRHLNYRGAEKFSRYLGGVLSQYAIEPAGQEDKSLWESRIAEFNKLRDENDAKPLQYNKGGK